ncbi:unnamed protein product [Aureobasidium pullulans]|nr:unnamed protein product [Aureobasidium pullulans]
MATSTSSEVSDFDSVIDYGVLTFNAGIAYQLVPEDPLIDNNQCQLDASLMKTLVLTPSASTTWTRMPITKTA